MPNFKYRFAVDLILKSQRIQMSNVETAKSLLRIATHDLGFDDHIVKNSAGASVSLNEVFESNVWLSSIMLNIDRACLLMFDCRAFDVCYIGCDSSADGIKVMDRSEVSPLLDTSTYDSKPVFNTSTHGAALHYTIVRGGLADSLSCKDGVAILRNLSPANLDDGSVMPFPDKNHIALFEFAGHFTSRNMNVISRMVSMFDKQPAQSPK